MLPAELVFRPGWALWQWVSRQLPLYISSAGAVDVTEQLVVVMEGITSIRGVPMTLSHGDLGKTIAVYIKRVGGHTSVVISQDSRINNGTI